MTRADARAFANRSRHRKTGRIGTCASFARRNTTGGRLLHHVHAPTHQNTYTTIHSLHGTLFPRVSANSSTTYWPLSNPQLRVLLMNRPLVSARECDTWKRNPGKASPRRADEYCRPVIDWQEDRLTGKSIIGISVGTASEENVVQCASIFGDAVIAIAEVVVSSWVVLSCICCSRVSRYTRSCISQKRNRCDCYDFLFGALTLFEKQIIFVYGSALQCARQIFW